MNNDYEKIRDFRNEYNQYARWLGIRTTVIREGYAEGIVEIKDHMRNPAGSVQGGLSYTLADAIAGSASASHGEHTATSDVSFYYLRPALDTKYLKAVATEVKKGKRQMIYDVIVLDDKDQIIAKGVFNNMPLGKPLDEKMGEKNRI